jgi:hypothetical protein
VASTPTADYVAGTNIMFYDMQPAPESPLTMVKVGGGSIGKPDGTFVFGYPRLFHDGTGELQLLWSEPQMPIPNMPAGLHPGEPAGSIWSAAYKDSSGWTKPAKVFSGSGIAWGPDDAIGFTANELVGIAAPMARAAAVFLRYAGGKWTASAIPDAGLSISTAFVGDQVIALASLVTINGRNTVFFRVSRDLGMTWEARRQVVDGQFPASYPKLFVDSQKRLHLIWVESGTATKQFKHAVSTNLGQSWSEPDAVQVPTLANNPTSTIDKCGRLVTFYEHWRAAGEPGHLDVVIWDGGWGQPEHVFPTLRGATAVVQTTARGDVIVVFTAQHVKPDPSLDARTYYSTASPAKPSSDR